MSMIRFICYCEVVKLCCILLYLIVVNVCVVTSSPLLPTFDIWSDGSVGNRTGGNSVNYSSLDLQERTARVLNFFPVPVDDECLSRDGRRSGICLNTYECRIQNGASHGPCALGFGVCCVFTAHCDMEVHNNITYIVSPNFPNLSRGKVTCVHQIKKIDAEISQIRLDFIHFHVGQPNRKTGVCESDVLIMSGGSSRDLKMCGFNNGQHVYYDVENTKDPISITLKMTRINVDRIWEIKVTQIPFTQRAPAGCLQYHTGTTGLIQTMNFADNGRHLANQNYMICIRQETEMCSIAYEPCDENSFRIGSANIGGPPSPVGGPPSPVGGISIVDNIPSIGAGGVGGEEGGGGAGVVNTPTLTSGGSSPSSTILNDQVPAADTPEGDVNNDQIEELGSGASALLLGRQDDYCDDRILLPCDSEDLILPGAISTSFCDIAHCGNSLCSAGEWPCRLESSVTPFRIEVQFGSPRVVGSPEDNIGMCLKYEQQTCSV